MFGIPIEALVVLVVIGFILLPKYIGSFRGTGTTTQILTKTAGNVPSTPIQQTPAQAGASKSGGFFKGLWKVAKGILMIVMISGIIGIVVFVGYLVYEALNTVPTGTVLMHKDRIPAKGVLKVPMLLRCQTLGTNSLVLPYIQRTVSGTNIIYRSSYRQIVDVRVFDFAVPQGTSCASAQKQLMKDGKIY